MARIRSIKPEFWTSEQVMECSPIARLLFIGMWNFADDHGRMPCTPKALKAQIFPGDDITNEAILRMVDELSTNRLVRIYTIDDKDYLFITGWHHQKIDKRQPAKYPEPPPDHSANVRRMVSTDRIGKEGKGEDRRGSDPRDSEANASGPPVGAPVYTDSRHELWGEGVPILISLGVADKQARSMIGTWLKSTKDDAQAVLAAIQRARDHRVHGPIPWITNSLKVPHEQANRPYRTAPSSGPAPTREAAIIAGAAAALDQFYEDRPAADRGRHGVRERADVAGADDANGSRAESDRGAPRQLEWVPARNTG